MCKSLTNYFPRNNDFLVTYFGKTQKFQCSSPLFPLGQYKITKIYHILPLLSGYNLLNLFIKSNFNIDSIITIISILGSLTSIYAFIHSIKLKDSIRNMVTY